MTQPAALESKPQLILIDKDGQITTDRAAAVRGEILETLPDGSVRSTLFVIDPPGKSR